MNILKNIASLSNIPQILKTGEVLRLVREELKRKRPGEPKPDKTGQATDR